MSSNVESLDRDMWTLFGDHYVAVNEAGRLRRGPPMRLLDTPFVEAYERPINAGVAAGHLVFFVHGGLNKLEQVIERIQRYDKVFGAEPWHLIHLAWDTSMGSAIDDVLLSFGGWRSWRNLLRLLRSVAPWNLIFHRRELYSAVGYFGGIGWKSHYDTALAATGLTRATDAERDRGFHRAFAYLNEAVSEGDGVQISFVVHSAGSTVANYLLGLIANEFPNLRGRVRNYILLAPGCHVAQFDQSQSAVNPVNPTVVLNLTPRLERQDDIRFRKKSLLWAVVDLFERRWKRQDYEKFRIPVHPIAPFSHLRNTSLVGLDEQVEQLETEAAYPWDRTVGGTVEWALTGVSRSIGGSPDRVWTEARTHGSFGGDPCTMESIKG